MTNRAKGNRARLQLKRSLEQQGWRVAVVELTGRYIKVKDLYGLFDLMAMRGSDVRLIQVTCNQPHPRRAYEEFSQMHHAQNILIQQYVKMDGNQWIKYTYQNGDTIREEAVV